jgi:hypothetical protein
MMYTLFDFLTHTKALGYVVAGLLLVSYIPFWRFLTEREHHSLLGKERTSRDRRP